MSLDHDYDFKIYPITTAHAANIMNYKTIILAFTVIAASLITGQVQGQNQSEMTTAQLERKDSTAAAIKIEALAQENRDERPMQNPKEKQQRLKRRMRNALKGTQTMLQSNRNMQ
jgi:hypothetical protein